MANDKKIIKMVDIVVPEENKPTETDLRKEIFKEEIKQPPKIEPPKDVAPAKKEIAKEIKEIKKEPAMSQPKGPDIKKISQTESFSLIAKKDKKDKDIEEDLSSIKPKSKFKRFLFWLIVLSTLGGSAYASIEYLPTAEIKITAQKINWNFGDWILASKNAPAVDTAKKQIPAEIFSDKKNINLAYAATGKKFVEQKAKGEIVIYNAYSSKSQLLVEDTRFAAPDGKIFYLDKKITVPGVKVEEGKIVPSSVKAAITAESAGTEYNIGPIEKLSIPGFKGSAKYDKFYATAQNPMAGGFTGEMTYPTEEDIKNAREKTTVSLKENLSSFLSAQIPKDFKKIDGGEQLSILNEKISDGIDENGNFSIFLEAELKIIAFKETDALNLINDLAKQALGSDYEIKNYKLDYQTSRPDFKNGELSFLAAYQGNFWKPIDIEDFKAAIIKKNESDLKIAVFALPGVERATVSFWPFWVKRVPDNLAKIKIEIE
ncbi:MAG: hypothetical protein AAB464_01050 [Patescibacteria group bacterium]